MRRPPALSVLVLPAVAVLIAVAVVFVMWARGEDSGSPSPRKVSPAIEAQATVAPRTALFGDTVRASVDVVLDAARVDPDSVRVTADFSPWEVVGRPERRVVFAGEQAYVRTTFVLRCVTSVCVPSGQSAQYAFGPGRVVFARSSGRLADEASIALSWPSFRVYSRFAAAALLNDQGSSAPWDADLLSLPAPSFRLAPGALAPVLLLAALVAALGAVGFAYIAWPRRVLAPPPEPEPEPELPPDPVLSPLEQALVLLERSVRVDGAADQRRALELVAEELERAEWGDSTLAYTARTLAWSEGVPPADETTELAAHVRSALDESYEERENGGGHAS